MSHAKKTAHRAADFDFSPAMLEKFALRLREGLPGHLGIELVEAQPGSMILQMAIQPIHTAANGYLHGGAVVTLADTACGFGCIANLPRGAHNFTTVELKTNFLSTALEGVIMAYATMRHAGSRTQIWDAEIRTARHPVHSPNDDTRILALFRCTQMILYPQVKSEESSANG